MKRKRSSDPEEIIDSVSESDDDTITNEGLGGNTSDATQQTTSDASDDSFRPSSDDTRKEQVCEKCTSLGFLRAFSTGGRKFTKPLVRIGQLRKDRERKSCSVCRLLNSVSCECPTHKAKTVYALYCVSEYSYGNSNSTLLYVLCEECKTSDSTINRKYGIACGATTKSPSGTVPQMLVDNIKPDRINFQTLRHWIERCEHHHSKTCAWFGETASYPKDLVLVDCHKRSLVESTPGIKYSALSYVWGRSEESSPPRYGLGDILHSTLPLTIEDAIKVTLGLGLDYIWIDRYCIDQTDNSKKHIQIGQMDLVYQNAHVTIIAAAGQDSSYGLPGISSRPRLVRPSARLRNFRLVAVPWKPNRVVQESTWMTRGWTFQEGFFAVRRLIFTEEQVFFECRKWSSLELNPVPRYESFKIFLDNNPREKRPWDITKLLASYSQRKLSFHTDAINAFEGVLHNLKNGRDPLTHHLGVLVIPSFFKGPLGGNKKANRTENDRLMSGLCWRSTSEGERRTGFPSWSWAGWTCEVHENHPKLTYGLCLDPDDAPKVVKEKMDSEGRNHGNLPAMEQWLESVGRTLTLEVWAIPLKLWDTTLVEDNVSLMLADLDKVFAIFENEQYLMRVEAEFICRSKEMESTSQDPLQAYDAKDIFGALFSGIGTSERSKGDFFFIVIERIGQDFRRIGHLDVSFLTAKVIKKQTNGKRQTSGWEKISLDDRHRLLFKDRMRLTVQLT